MSQPSGKSKVANTYWSLADQEFNGAKDAFESGGLGALNKFIVFKAEEWKDVDLNIGVIGMSGAGKTTLINTMRGLQASDPGAGRVGLTETTKEPKPYTHPRNEKMVLWDLPGVGTSNFPRETYVTQIEFDRFGFFLIVAQVRFFENDKWIAEQIRNVNKQFFFVRTKISQDMQNNKADYPDEHDPEKVLANIRSDIENNLGDLYDETKVFLVDSRRKEFEFNEMVVKLLQDFPRLKAEALILTIGTFSAEIVKAKVQVLRERVWKAALMSAAGGAIPVPGLSCAIDLGVVVRELAFYREQLGIDMQSLLILAATEDIDLGKLLEKAGRWPGMTLSVATAKALVAEVSEVLAAIAVEEAARFIPFVGSLVGGAMSFSTTYCFLSDMLSEMEASALAVVAATLAWKGSASSALKTW